MAQIYPDTIRAETSAFLILAAGLLILPLPWLGAAILAAIVHEFFHWLAVYLCGGRIYRLRIGSQGAVMDAPPMPPGKNLICALAGPLGGLSVLFLGRWMPRTALCAVFQSCYNLLPIRPLDGGLALESLLALFLSPPIVRKICRITEVLIYLFILCLGVYAALILRAGIWAFLFALAAITRIHGNSGKTPCKASQFTIQ